MADLSRITPSVLPPGAGIPMGTPPSPLGRPPAPPIPPPQKTPLPIASQEEKAYGVDKFFGKGTIKTGKGYASEHGVTGIRRQFARLRYSREERNLSQHDTDTMEALVHKYAKSLPTGVGFDRKTKKRMLYEAYRMQEKFVGKEGLSHADFEDFKRIVRNL